LLEIVQLLEVAVADVPPGLVAVGGCDIAIRQMPEVELHTGLQAPFQWNLVDGP